MSMVLGRVNRQCPRLESRGMRACRPHRGHLLTTQNCHQIEMGPTEQCWQPRDWQKVVFIDEFSFQPVLHDWCNKGRGMCYAVCGMMHIKEPLLLIGKSSLCGGSRFPLSLSEWSFTICLTSYNPNKMC